MQVYCIRNLLNGKVYVGQTTSSFYKRYRKGQWWLTTKNPALINSLKKHGRENFSIKILEDGVKTLKQLNLLEVFWAEKLRAYSPTGYNLIGCGNNKLATQKLRKKLSDAHKGKKLSEETKAKIGAASRRYYRDPKIRTIAAHRSLAMWNRPGHRENTSRLQKALWVKNRQNYTGSLSALRSRPTKATFWVSLVLRSRTTPVVQDNTYLYPSANLAAVALCISVASVIKCCNKSKGIKSAGGKTWRHASSREAALLRKFVRSNREEIRTLYLRGGLTSIARYFKSQSLQIPL